MRRGAVIAFGICMALMAAVGSALTTGRYTEKPVPGTSQLYDASCPPKGSCMVVGASKQSATKRQTGVFGKFIGGRVGKLTRVSRTVALSELQCAQANFCMAVGQSSSGSSPGAFVPIVKGKPGKAQLSKDYLIGVGCGPNRSCWITGVNPHNGDAVVVHTAGAKITQRRELKGISFSGGEGSAPPAPRCVSASRCMGVGTMSFSKGPAIVYSLVNGKLASFKKVTGASAFTGLACPSANNCLVTGVKPTGGRNFAGIIMRLKNGNPGPVTVVKGTSFLGAVACSSKNRCWAFGGEAAQSQVVPITKQIGKAIKLAAPVHAATCNRSSCLGVGTRGTYPQPSSGFTLSFF